MTTNTIALTGIPLFLDLFASNLKHLVQTLVKYMPKKPCNTETELQHDPQRTDDHGPKGENLSKVDVKTVMNKLGLIMFYDHDSDQFGEEDVERVFNEEEPSLAELKEAFDVYDANKDGFIDASELGRVLCILGLVREFKRSECMRMIKAVDANGDGVVDFSEFVKFMKGSFSE